MQHWARAFGEFGDLFESVVLVDGELDPCLFFKFGILSKCRAERMRRRRINKKPHKFHRNFPFSLLQCRRTPSSLA